MTGSVRIAGSGSGPIFDGSRAPRPRPSVTLDHTGEHGTFLARLTNGNLSWSFLDTDFFQAFVWRPSLAQVVTLTPEDFTVERIQDEDAFRLRCTCHTVLGLVLDLSMRPANDGFSFEATATAPFGSDVLQYLDWPRIRFVPPGVASDLFGFTPYTTGFVTRSPQGASVVLLAQWPGSMQTAGWWDQTSKLCLTFRVEDDDARFKGWLSFGDGTTVTSFVRHYSDRQNVPGSTIETTYRTLLETFRSRTSDGRYAFYEITERYARWATLPQRPWNVRGNWWEAAGFSTTVADMDVYLTYSGPATLAQILAVLEGVNREGIGVNRVVIVYPWWDGAVTTPPSLWPYSGSDLKAGWDDFLVDAHALGWKVGVFLNAREWNGDCLTPFDRSNYATFGDLTAYGVKDRDGVPIAVGPAAQLMAADWARPEWEDVLPDLISRILDLHSRGDVPDGIYFDADLLLDTTLQLDPAATTWSPALWYAGRRAAMAAMLDAARAVTGDFFMATEWADEQTFPYVDVNFLNVHQPQGFWVGTMPQVYAHVTRFTAFGPPWVENHLYLNAIDLWRQTFAWLRTGVASVNDGTYSYVADPVLFHEPLEDSPLYYAIVWWKKLAAAGDRYRSDFRGRLTVPALETWEGPMLTSGQADIVGFLNVYLPGHLEECLPFSATWLRHDGVLSCFVAFALTGAGDVLPAHVGIVPFMTTQTRTIRFSTERWPLPAERKGVYLDDGTTETLLAEFDVECEVVVDFDPWTIYRLQVRPL